MHLRPRRRHAIPLIAALMLTAAGAVAPTAAYADRCEPEEIVLGPDTSPIDERDNPVCTAFFFYVYPFICSPNGVPPATLIGANGCTSNISLRPTYVPPLIPPYSPNAGRLVCNLVLYANPNGTCVFTADPATGDTHITTHLGSITIPAQPSSTTDGQTT
jgi:hypothetical protein